LNPHDVHPSNAEMVGPKRSQQRTLFWAVTLSFAAVAAVYPLILSSGLLEEANRVGGHGATDTSWIGAMTDLAMAAFFAGSAIVVFSAVVTMAVVARCIVRRRHRRPTDVPGSPERLASMGRQA
jgi:hypothetical protein